MSNLNKNIFFEGDVVSVVTLLFWGDVKTRAVARVPVLPVFEPERKQAKIFAAFLLFTPKSLKCTFFVLTTKVIKSGVVRKQKRSRGVRYTQDKSRKYLRLLYLGRKRVPGPQP